VAGLRSVLRIAGIGAYACQRLVPSQSIRDYGVFGMLALSISLCWGFGGILNLGQEFRLPWRLRHGDDDADADAGCVKSDAAIHVEQQSRSFAAVYGEPFRQNRAGYRSGAGGPDAICAIFGGLMFRARSPDHSSRS